MVAPKQLSAKKVARAIRDANGLLSFAAQSLGCSRQTVYEHIRKYACCAEAVEEARNKFVDVAESKMMKAVQSEQPWAVALICKTLGRKRGYVERTEHEVAGEGGGPLVMEFVVDDGKKRDKTADQPSAEAG